MLSCVCSRREMCISRTIFALTHLTQWLWDVIFSVSTHPLQIKIVFKGANLPTHQPTITCPVKFSNSLKGQRNWTQDQNLWNLCFPSWLCHFSPPWPLMNPLSQVGAVQWHTVLESLGVLLCPHCEMQHLAKAPALLALCHWELVSSGGATEVDLLVTECTSGGGTSAVLVLSL